MRWERLKRAGLIATFVLFTIAGVALAVFGEGSDRFFGLGTVLFFGGGGAAWWFVTRGGRRGPGFEVGRASVTGGHEAAFIGRTSTRSLVVQAVGGIVVGAGALALAIPESGMERWLFLGSGVFFVGIGLFGLYRLRGTPTLALTRSGIRATGPGGWFVPWDSIVGVRELAVYDNPFLAIHVADPALIEMGGTQRVLHSVERSMIGSDVSFPLRTLEVDPAELHAAIGRYLEHPEHRPRIGLEDELTVIREAAAPQG